MDTILVSIVCYRSGDVTVDCLASLESEVASLPGSRVVVVDNDSGDGSAATVERAIRQREWSNWCQLERAPRNGGYAYGNNLAIRSEYAAGRVPDLVFVLNPDTVVRPGAIRVLIDFLAEHPEVGITGSCSEDEDGTPQHCCFRFHNWLNEFACQARVGVIDRILRRVICRVPISDVPHQIDWVSGAAMLIRREVVDNVGLMDEGFFLYYEENDLIHRARRSGWTCWYIPHSHIVHHVGHSSGVTRRDQKLARKPPYWFESRRRYYLKNRGKLYTILADLAAMSGVALWNLRCALSRRTNNNPPHLFSDFVRHSVFRTGFRLAPPPRHEPPQVASPASSSASRT